MKSHSIISEQGEMLILADGKILAHNITPEIAAALSVLDPKNEAMRQRAETDLRSAGFQIKDGLEPALQRNIEK